MSDENTFVTDMGSAVTKEDLQEKTVRLSDTESYTFHSCQLYLAYREVRAKAIRDGLDSKDFDDPYLDSVSKRVFYAPEVGRMTTAYYIGWMRGILYADRMDILHNLEGESQTCVMDEKELTGYSKKALGGFSKEEAPST